METVLTLELSSTVQIPVGRGYGLKHEYTMITYCRWGYASHICWLAWVLRMHGRQLLAKVFDINIMLIAIILAMYMKNQVIQSQPHVSVGQMRGGKGLPSSQTASPAGWACDLSKKEHRGTPEMKAWRILQWLRRQQRQRTPNAAAHRQAEEIFTTSYLNRRQQSHRQCDRWKECKWKKKQEPCLQI